jgi:catechol 2,3-dioxygenase-like lactoylglutathione lyase family enzyme
MATITSTAPILPVSDMERAVRFYQSLGFQSRDYDATYVFLTRGSHDIHLRKAPDLIEGKNPSGIYFYLETGAADLEAEFRAAGVSILSPLSPREWKMNEFMVSDPDGNLLRFGERLPQ